MINDKKIKNLMTDAYNKLQEVNKFLLDIETSCEIDMDKLDEFKKLQNDINNLLETINSDFWVQT
jgi:hypothetical protein